jgi:histidine triad (HIT) family protein
MRERFAESTRGKWGQGGRVGRGGGADRKLSGHGATILPRHPSERPVPGCGKMSGMETEITDSLFARIVRGEIPVTVVYENEHVLAFPDIAPQAPVHVLVIPKRPVRNVLTLSPEDTELAGHILLACAEVARITGIEGDGCRVVLNAGKSGGQTVPYLHAHVLGGRDLTWPPG